MNYDDLRSAATDDQSETKRFIRCELCGKLVEDGQQFGWRVLLTDGFPMWACAEEFEANAAEAEHRLQTLHDARTHKTPALTPAEWLAIFGD